MCRSAAAIHTQGPSSWADCLNAAGLGGVGAGLISAAAMANVMGLAAALPPLAGGGIECHLGDANRVDVAVRLMAQDGGLDGLLDRHAVLRFPESLTQSADWQRVRELGHRWATPKTPYQTGIDSLWLEFDLPDGGGVRVPSLFFGLTDAQRAAAIDGGFVADSAALLARPLRAQGVCEGLRRMQALRAPTATVAFIGLMLSRDDAGVRVVLKGLSASALLAQVTKLGWTGDLAAIEIMLREIVDPSSALALHVDFAPALGPAIGIEIAIDGHPRYSASWQRLLHGLLARGLCDGAQLDGLMDWPSVRSFTEDSPADAPWSAFRGIVRRINHVKLVLHPQRPPIAKAYLYCGLLARAESGRNP